MDVLFVDNYNEKEIKKSPYGQNSQFTSKDKLLPTKSSQTN
jgi:hypothetical protein